MTSLPAAYLDTELELSSLDAARFSWSGGDYRGRPALGPELAEQLLALEGGDPEAYGFTLYESVFPRDSEIRAGLREAIVATEREKSRLRFRLHLSLDLPDWVHALYWELLTDPERHLALARSPDTAFSRYLDARRAQGVPAPERPRLLCVVSAPSDIARYGMAELVRDDVRKHLETAFGELADAVEVSFLEPPATLGRLRDRLMERKGFQLLHFFGHGLSRNGVSALILENDQGNVQAADEKLLAEVFLGVRELRLVTLVACHGGAPSSGDPFSGLAGRLVQRGVPSVIAMRRAVRISSAHLFTQHLYRHIAQTGRADAAVNEARQQLFLARPREIDWSSPVLYSRVSDGRLWLPPAEADAMEERRPRIRLALHRLHRPLPWVPALLALVLLVLGLWPAPRAEVRFDLQASQLFFRLAKSATVVERLDLEDLAVARLGALRLPMSQPFRAAAGGEKGFLLATRGDGSHVTLHTPPLPPGTGFAVEHQGARAYRLTVTDSGEPLRVTFLGDVMLKLLTAPAIQLHAEDPDGLVLHPRSGTAAVDVTFARFAPDSFAGNVAIAALDLDRVTEQQTAATTVLQKESTLLDGTVHVLATGRSVRLARGEALRYSALAGSLTHLRLDGNGLRCGFQGWVSGLERVASGLPPERLMPSVLDLAITGRARVAVQVAAWIAALLVLGLTTLDFKFFSRKDIEMRSNILPLLALLILFVHGSPVSAQVEKRIYKLGLISGEKEQRYESENVRRYREQVLNAATSAFFATRRFSMVERRQLDAVFTEKSLQEFIGGQPNSKLTDVLGLDLVGIVNYSFESSKSADGTTLTKCIIDVRLVDVKTATIFATLSSNHSSSIYLPSSTPRQAAQLLYKSIRDTFPPLGYVVSVNGKEVIVDLGTNAGLKNGDTLEIVKEGEQIIHPVTGKVLSSPMKVVGELKVVEASAQLSTCRLKSKAVPTVTSLVRLKGSNSRFLELLGKVSLVKSAIHAGGEVHR